MQAAPQDGWKVLERAVELSRKGERFVLASVVWRQSPSSSNEGSRAIVTADGSMFGWIGGACAEPVLIRESLAALEDGKPRLLVLGMDQPELPEGMISVPFSCQSEGALQVHIEPVVPAPTVIVIGRSPMAETLVEFVDALGWHGILSDPADRVEIPSGAAVVVATQGYGDEEILLEAVGAEVSYLGLVASERRGTAVLDYLRDRGVAEETLGTIKVPAGLDLGPTSHREMAASILAELVAVRAAGGLGVPAAASVERPATAIDPICGMEVTADETSRPFEYEGVTYYFCCPGCRSTFAADPESHLRRTHADHE